MNRDELRNALRQSYDRANWTQLMRNVFGRNVRLNAEAQPLPTDDASIKSIAQIGDVLLDDGKTLAVIEVEVGDDINLLRNRVSLRNRVAKFIDQDRAHGVLAVFSSASPEYRFSFTARETLFDEELGMVEKETATKRFTYVLGPAETCNTAAERFERLSQKSEQIRIDDVVEAFSVEKLNKEFFNTYKDHYERFCNHLLSDAERTATYALFNIRKVANAADQTRLEKPVRDFVKRLLGRIVFLHFLQKKGWMGCPAGHSDWKGGDLHFMASYYEQTEDKSRFHSNRLLPLFYEALNHPHRPEAVFEPTGTRIPYLNGGLFEKMIERENAIDFPADYFHALLDFFAQYNFTIDENDPNEHEVGIDPEMLGHIFENLLEDNKDKGAYYTPKAIVHYMCQQSLIYYLLRHLGRTPEAEAAITYLVRNKQIGEGTSHEKYNNANAAKIETLLDAVKICDPAIGSGAFPIGLLQEIFWLKLTLDRTLNDPSQLARIKRDIIQNSIYGVDIDAGAVDIARLRFWLALVVDETEPSPLPNLDYKIMQGDSLLESFEGARLDNLMEDAATGGVTISPTAQTELDFASEQMLLKAGEKADQITQLMRDYFEAESPEKKSRIHRQIDTFVREHIEFNLLVAEEEFETELHQHNTDIRSKRAQAPAWSPPAKQVKRIAYLKKSIAELGEKKKRLEKLAHEAERPYFLWHLFFKDVFAQGGFDIVIANPPYVRQEAIKDKKPMLAAEYGDFFTSTADLFVYFYDKALNILKDSGQLCFISSSKFFRSGYGLKLRQLLKAHTIHNIIDFGELPVFAAGTDPAIIFLEKGPADESHSITVAAIKHSREIQKPFEAVELRGKKLQQCILNDSSWSVEAGESTILLNKLRGKGTPLGEYVKGRFYRGILTGLNEAFVVDRATRDRLIAEHPSSEEVLKPFINGREVKRWNHSKIDNWLIFMRRGLSIEKFPAIMTYLKGFKHKLTPGVSGGRKKGSYLWYEIQDNIAYWEEFMEDKIIFNETSKELHAFIDNKGLYTNKTCFIIVGPELKFLLSFLMSSVIDWMCRCEFPAWGDPWKGGRIQFRKDRMVNIPIPFASDEQKSRLSKLATAAAEAATKDDTTALAAIEDEINQIVYRLFDLTPEEIRLIERTINKDLNPS